MLSHFFIICRINFMTLLLHWALMEGCSTIDDINRKSPKLFFYRLHWDQRPKLTEQACYCSPSLHPYLSLSLSPISVAENASLITKERGGEVEPLLTIMWERGFFLLSFYSIVAALFLSMLMPQPLFQTMHGALRACSIKAAVIWITQSPLQPLFLRA